MYKCGCHSNNFLSQGLQLQSKVLFKHHKYEMNRRNTDFKKQNSKDNKANLIT